MNLLYAYGCGSPIRLPLVHALAIGSSANKFIPDPNPLYLGGNSIVWGLIRGADRIMQQTSNNGHKYYQIDNAYFCRNVYFRVTCNALQLNFLPKHVIDNRYIKILNSMGRAIEPWKKNRNGPIVICPSSNLLYKYMGTTLEDWINLVISQIKNLTSRPIKIRYKELMPKDDIDKDISDAWCVVTHVSASALDALRLGIPVVTTGSCAASSLSTALNNIESPFLGDGRDELFSLLANGQFTLEELINKPVLEIVDKFYDLNSVLK